MMTREACRDGHTLAGQWVACWPWEGRRGEGADSRPATEAGGDETFIGHRRGRAGGPFVVVTATMKPRATP